jgi:hypothetical protein
MRRKEMAQVTVTKALSGYFNVEPRKVPAQEWLKELKALTPDEKRELAEAVCKATGDTLAAA